MALEIVTLLQTGRLWQEYWAWKTQGLVVPG